MNSFPPIRRLKRRRLIKSLFDRNVSSVIQSGCIRLVFRTVHRSSTGVDTPLQVGFAPNRQRTKVARNRVRRIMRETWRMHEHLLDMSMIDEDRTVTVMVLCKKPEQESCLRTDLVAAMQRLSVTLTDTRSGGP